MSNHNLIHLNSLPASKILEIFSLARSFKKQATQAHPKENLSKIKNPSTGLIFFEPSTRTRFSFESAAQRLGLGSLVLEGSRGTSLEKGETLRDTVLNMAAMNPGSLVIRCNENFDLESVAKEIDIPIICAGWGLRAHPTQALLDIFTLIEQGMKLEDIRLVIIGDAAHSRVAASHLELAHLLKYEIAICSPEELSIRNKNSAFLFPQAQELRSIDEALEWGNALMPLRVQFERHQGGKFNEKQYTQDFQLNSMRLAKVTDQWLMHPGPINYGIEVDQSFENHPRNIVLKQVSHGVWVRQAILALWGNHFYE